jgi:hypothetical protein
MSPKPTYRVLACENGRPHHLNASVMNDVAVESKLLAHWFHSETMLLAYSIVRAPAGCCENSNLSWNISGAGTTECYQKTDVQNHRPVSAWLTHYRNRGV